MAEKIFQKGMIFGFDLLVYFLVLCIMLYFVAWATNSLISEQAREIKEMEFKKKSVFLLDSLVKNRDANNPVNGSAFYDSEAKRVQENVIELELLEKIDEKSAPKEFKELFFEKENMKAFLIEEEKKGECISLKRFVVFRHFQSQKGIIGAVFCNG